MTGADIAARIHGFYLATYPHLGQVLTLDTDLLNDWFVDSFGVVQTVQFLEDTFGIEVRRAEVNVHNFKCIRALAAYVLQKLG